MPRLSKKQKLEWSLFINEKGRRQYNELCRKCSNDCKQTFRCTIIDCPLYVSKRGRYRHRKYNTAS